LVYEELKDFMAVLPTVGPQYLPTLLDINDLDVRRVEPRPVSFLSRVFSCVNCPEVRLKAKLSQLDISLSVTQIIEMVKVTQVVFSKVFTDPVVNLRIGFRLDEATTTTMGYLVRSGQDVVVYPKVRAACGVDKEVRVAVSISEDGNVKLLEEVRLRKSVRSDRPLNRLLDEFNKRREFSEEFVCAPGDLYQYMGKNGGVKLTWLMRHYTTCGERFVRALISPGAREKKMPYRQEACIQLILGASKALQHIHSKNHIHRDVKLANILFSISPKTHQVDSVVLTDLVFTRSIDDIQRTCEMIIEYVKSNHRYEELKALNPIFKAHCVGQSIPSTEDYKLAHQFAEVKDPQSAAIVVFLENLDDSIKVGTPGHIPPEFWHTRSYSKAGDIYALGVALNNLLVVLHEADIRFTDSMIDVGLEGLVGDMCQEDPRLRPTIDQVIARLERIVWIYDYTSI